MTLKSLLNKGGPERGKLEAFADGCNAMARSFWLNHTVTVVKSGETNPLKADSHKSQTDHWVSNARFFVDSHGGGAAGGFSLSIAGVILLAYAITCIPVGLVMGVGLAAKKIALSRDDKAKKYQAVVEKYLSVSRKNKELEQLRSEKTEKEKELAPLLEKQKGLENTKISAEEQNVEGQKLKKKHEEVLRELKGDNELRKGVIESLETEIQKKENAIQEEKNAIEQQIRQSQLNLKLA